MVRILFIRICGQRCGQSAGVCPQWFHHKNWQSWGFPIELASMSLIHCSVVYGCFVENGLFGFGSCCCWCWLVAQRNVGGLAFLTQFFRVGPAESARAKWWKRQFAPVDRQMIVCDGLFHILKSLPSMLESSWQVPIPIVGQFLWNSLSEGYHGLEKRPAFSN